jgi:hypothetical protein
MVAAGWRLKTCQAFIGKERAERKKSPSRSERGLKTSFRGLNRAGADGGTRTRTALSGQRILSPLRLPFRHIGARAKANEAAHRWTGKRNFFGRIKRVRSSERYDYAQSD